VGGEIRWGEGEESERTKERKMGKVVRRGKSDPS